MYTSSIIRAVAFFTLSSLPLFASATPISALELSADGTMVERSIEEREAYAGRTNGTYSWINERSYDEYENGQLVRRAGSEYVLDCLSVPEICANICYYANCKRGSLTQHPKKGRTEAAACAKRPNKCSTGHKGSWGPYPHSGYQCDEFPLASSQEGGNRNSATRCVPARQNGSAGAKFKFPTGAAIPTVLLNKKYAPFYCDGRCSTSRDRDGRQE